MESTQANSTKTFLQSKHITLIELESKVISVNERGLTSTQWSVYNTDTKRIRGFSPCFQFITYEKHNLFIVVVIVRYVFC